MSKFYNSHYSYTQNPQRLVEWARGVALDLKKLSKKLRKMPVLMYTGMSGVASATALATGYACLKHDDKTFGGQLGMLYVRKEHETSHGEPLERGGPYENHPCFFVFVDDFISGGTTIGRVTSVVKRSFSELDATDVYTAMMELRGEQTKLLRKFHPREYEFFDDNVRRSMGFAADTYLGTYLS